MSDSLSRQELDLILTEELVRVEPQALGIYERYRAVPELVVREYPHSSMRVVSDQVYVIARIGRRVLFYDDVEEEFGTAELDLETVLCAIGVLGGKNCRGHSGNFLLPTEQTTME